MNDYPPDAQEDGTWSRRTRVFYSISLGIGLVALISHSLLFVYFAYIAIIAPPESMWEALGALAMMVGFFLPLIIGFGFLFPLLASLTASAIAFSDPQPYDSRYACQGPVLVLTGVINLVVFILFALSSVLETVLTEENALICSLLLATMAGPAVVCLVLRMAFKKRRSRSENGTSNLNEALHSSPVSESINR